jgi:ribonuclease Y
MDSTVLYIIIAVICLAVGVLVGKLIFSKNTRKQIEDANQQSQKILSDAQLSAETLKKEKLLEAKERFVQLQI